jgi:hypothetical protein
MKRSNQADGGTQRGAGPNSRSPNDKQRPPHEVKVVRSAQRAVRPKVASASNGSPPGIFLAAQPPTYWHDLGIYPEALGPLGRLDTVPAESLRALNGLGIGNLRLLCEQSGIARPDDASEAVLGQLLLSASDPATPIHLREFLKRRTEAVETVFEHALRVKRRTSLATSVRELSPRRAEVLKPLTKLILLYREDPQLLVQIHGEALWQSRTTSFEFRAPAPLPSQFPRAISQRVDELKLKFSKAAGRREIKYLGTRKLTDGTTVYAFVREYNPVVRQDFHKNYVVYYGCGLLLFGIDPSRSRIFVKTGSRGIADELADFIQSTFSVELSLVYNEVFSDYTIEDLGLRVLGGYQENQGIEIIAAAFARSGFESHGSISLGAPLLQPSIRKDLEHLRHDDLVEIRSPADVASLTLTFRGRPIVVSSVVVEGGAVRFSYDDAGWNTQMADDFGAAFSSAFGIPLNRLLHPGRAMFGSVGIFASLLGLTDEDSVQGYQEEYLAKLLERELVQREPLASRICRSNLCSNRNRPVDDETRHTCPQCSGELHDWQYNRLVRNDGRVADFVANALDDADDWTLHGEERKLDKWKYYELRRQQPGGREDFVCMILTDRAAVPAKRVFQRTGLPLLMVRTHTDSRYAYVDDDGIAHVSLAYLLSADESPATKAQRKDLCRGVLQQLVHNHEERILRAARLSYARLLATGNELTGDQYEDDVFNLLRSIFPYTYRLGKRGEVEPDGFVCVPQYENESIEDVGSWNWSYDAKHTDTRKRKNGYDLNIDEARKIAHYVKKLRRSRTALFGKNRRARAHILISNQLPEKRMQRAAETVFGADGVGPKCADIRLLLMKQDFLVSLYESVRDKYEQLVRRRPFFCDDFIELIQSTPQAGYRILARADAEALINSVLEKPEVEANVDPKALAKSLPD